MIVRNKRFRLIVALLGLFFPVWLAAADNEFSTTKDGSLQAIAQGPRSINVYWKAGTKVPQPVQLLVNGKPCSSCTQQLERMGNFYSCTLDGLEANTLYTFSLGSEGPSVSEKTWCELPDRAEYDLLVIGGSASGTAAAVTAARFGLRVALVEETNRIGGMASNGLGSTDIRDPSRSNGFFEDFRRRVVDFYGEGNGLRYEPRVALAIFKQMVYEHANIHLYLKCEVEKPILIDGTRVIGAEIRDSVSNKRGTIFAHTTVDATHTGDFAAMCGCEFRVGREPRSPEEPHAGVIYFNNATQEILPGSTGEGDNKQQSYAYLMIWKDYGQSGAPLIDKPRFYDPETYRYSPEWTKTWNYTSGRLPNGKFEINQHPFGIDWPCINHEYPTADKSTRRAIEDMYRDRALGYLYFFQNERGHTNLGLADDEFLDNNNFPVSLYVREARRIMGEYLFKECDVSKAREFYRADSIGIGDYPMDSHATEDLKDPTRIDKGEGEFWLRAFTPWYQIPYGIIVPKRIDGLLVSTAVSATHVGYGTLRMEPVRMSLGQAAAACAYWSKLYSINPRRVRAAWVQDRILSQYAYITWNSDVSRDTRHFKAINFTAARGIFREETFEPQRPLTFGEAIAALNKLLALEGSRETLSQPEDPDRICTRGEFAILLAAAKQKTSPDWIVHLPPWSSYDDVPRSSPYYGAVETLKAKRISTYLFEDAERGMFKPDEPITRADAAQAIYLAHRAHAMNYWMP